LAAVALALLAVAGGIWATRLTTDNRLDRMLSEHGEEAERYREFLEHYGSDEFIIAAFTGKPILDAEAFAAILAAYERLLEAPPVERVSGIPQLYLERFGAEDPDALIDELTSTPFYHGLFLSEDHSNAGMLIQTAVLDAPGEREALVAAVDEALEPLREYGFTTHLVGAWTPAACRRCSRREATSRRRAFAAYSGTRASAA